MHPALSPIADGGRRRGAYALAGRPKTTALVPSVARPDLSALRFKGHPLMVAPTRTKGEHPTIPGLYHMALKRSVGKGKWRTVVTGWFGPAEIESIAVALSRAEISLADIDTVWLASTSSPAAAPSPPASSAAALCPQPLAVIGPAGPPPQAGSWALVPPDTTVVFNGYHMFSNPIHAVVDRERGFRALDPVPVLYWYIKAGNVPIADGWFGPDELLPRVAAACQDDNVHSNAFAAPFNEPLPLEDPRHVDVRKRRTDQVRILPEASRAPVPDSVDFSLDNYWLYGLPLTTSLTVASGMHPVVREAAYVHVVLSQMGGRALWCGWATPHETRYVAYCLVRDAAIAYAVDAGSALHSQLDAQLKLLPDPASLSSLDLDVPGDMSLKLTLDANAGVRPRPNRPPQYRFKVYDANWNLLDKPRWASVDSLASVIATAKNRLKRLRAAAGSPSRPAKRIKSSRP
ncbi:uncharacterized protein AMSG_09288 [Thecamonas trahens ATCC 50062]|uniref:Uncharacterized protein n=1 Tax=Thecamonas trahens ATCC 50062 TaxID=461836 RepID=A0A0L0DP56_THETB|nr:hypothetical protein AMSG_09288 [Thecamonas trahens ATCC 50062]KNC53203.1 hypothetical protein AMSG_09288 [Thecamonas trahens ATCC 50062]|eukprot:XP_013754673.1 hypothetical protein AMSG_09288 [Thecamonas trahens ATCC 50062]